MDQNEMLELLDYKRKVAELYAVVRRSKNPQEAWDVWRTARSVLFIEHPQSALLPEERVSGRLTYFPYEPSFRIHATVSGTTPASFEIPSSDGGTMTFSRTAEARFEIGSTEYSLECFWLEGYGGGLFLPFKDATSGATTYGGGRYLLDTVKGADLGISSEYGEGGHLVLDFNFAYNPSCSYNPKWACPLSPPANTLDIEILAGEKHQAQ